jgi:hypothetical protein
MTGTLTNIENVASAQREATPQPTRKAAVARPAMDRLSIERWEGEGGRALAHEAPARGASARDTDAAA